MPVSTNNAPKLNLTHGQRRCLDAIERLSRAGVGPTYRELAEALGIRSKGALACTIERLVARGHLRRRPGCARSLTLT